MTIGTLIKYLEEFAPPGAAWEKDNVGLQIGALNERLSNILLSLDLTNSVLREAISKKCNFIFTHHPILFHPIRRLDFDYNDRAKLIRDLIKNNITVYSAHTNLDFTKEGVSFQIARKLKLHNISFLENLNGNQIKLVAFVPMEHLPVVSKAIFDAGGGIIGEYSNCGFSTDGTGTFRGSEHSSPAVGKKLQFESTEEVRLEVLVHKWKLNKVITAMLSVHPYDEPAYDIYPLLNENINYGYGAIGELEKPMRKNEFLKFVSDSIKANNLRYAEGKRGTIKRVAVCGGSCSDKLRTAIKKGADAFITADISYHIFQEAEGKMLFIDAGHFETEIHSLGYIKKITEDFISKHDNNIKVYKYRGFTNPVKFFNNVGVK